MKGRYLWVGVLVGAVVGFLAASFVGNLGLAMGGGAILGMILSQALYFRR